MNEQSRGVPQCEIQSRADSIVTPDTTTNLGEGLEVTARPEYSYDLEGASWQEELDNLSFLIELMEKRYKQGNETVRSGFEQLYVKNYRYIRRAAMFKGESEPDIDASTQITLDFFRESRIEYGRLIERPGDKVDSTGIDKNKHISKLYLPPRDIRTLSAIYGLTGERIQPEKVIELTGYKNPTHRARDIVGRIGRHIGSVL